MINESILPILSKMIKKILLTKNFNLKLKFLKYNKNH